MSREVTPPETAWQKEPAYRVNSSVPDVVRPAHFDDTAVLQTPPKISRAAIKVEALQLRKFNQGIESLAERGGKLLQCNTSACFELLGYEKQVARTASVIWAWDGLIGPEESNVALA